MEEDDEFGDLYSDVLPPFQSSAPPPPPPSLPRPFNLNNGNCLPAPNSTIPPPPDKLASYSGTDGVAGVELAAAPRVLDCGGAKVLDRALEDASYDGKGSGHEKVGDIKEMDIKFDIEEGNNGIDDMDSDPIIPGLSTGGDVAGVEGEDWDSDSEDDLQIVLNDNNHGPMAMEREGMPGEDENEDGDPLVIVADGGANQAMEEQGWGVDASLAADGERKDMGEAGKPNGGMVIAPKVGYGTQGFHPFHSQFKYVRPGAAPIPGSNIPVPGGAPGPVRPLMNIGPIAGRGRGDWRPPMQKGFPSGFGAPAWGAGRGFGGGGGLEFTLPSHKTIFEVDVDSFEEKPWKYPGIDISDFFNFGLNEEGWKGYCKHLEQLRLESTMQSKIRVYESGRTEQDYDPDLPPELAAAATGAHDAAANNAYIGKLDAGQNDLHLARGSAHIRPPMPTGRAIQVEGGYGERLPSIDTRPPRARDSDAIIEIVCQDSMDDNSSTGNLVEDEPENDPSREDLRGHEAAKDVAPLENEYFNGFPQTYNNRKREIVGRRMPERDGVLPLPPDVSFGSLHEERRMQGRGRERSPRTSRDTKSFDNQKEESFESTESKHGQLLLSPVAEEILEDSGIDYKDAMPDDLVLAKGNSEIEIDTLEANVENDTFKDGDLLEKQNMSTRVEPDEEEDPKAARSRENSKARSGSSRDFEKWRDGVDEEVTQDGHGSHMGGIKRHLDDEKSFRRKYVEGRQGEERNHMVARRGEDSYSYRDWDPSLGKHFQVKNEGFDRRKERENPDGTWQRRDDDPQSRRVRAEDTRKRKPGEEIRSRHRSKVHESERTDKDEYLDARKQLDNGSYRVSYDNDFGSRHRGRDENLKSRYENGDEYHIKRRKEEDYLRREHVKEENLHSNPENSSRRNVVDQRKRDDQPRTKDDLDDNHSGRRKDEGWVPRERTERQRVREDWHRQKQSHEENLLKRKRDEAQSTSKSGRGAEETAWFGHDRAKDEYKSSVKEHQLKETAHHTEQLKRRDRILRDDVHVRENQLTSGDERRSRQERSSSRNDHAINVSDNQRAHERKNKESTRKNKESEGGDEITLKRHQGDKSSHVNETGVKGVNGRNSERHSSRKHKEEAASDDEQQASRRGRSKLERWTSHQERDFMINSKSMSSLMFKEADANNHQGSSEGIKIPEVSTKTADQHISAEEKNASEHEVKESDRQPLDDRHLDTVEKLKKRSERFKLPMPVEKEPSATQNEAPGGDLEIKPERPPRKRRWISQ